MDIIVLLCAMLLCSSFREIHWSDGKYAAAAVPSSDVSEEAKESSKAGENRVERRLLSGAHSSAEEDCSKGARCST